MLNIGLVYPQTEFGNDPGAIRDYAQTAEELGYSHILAYDHVLGANPNRPGGWQGPYTSETPFHEPFVLFSYMAGFTQRLGFVTGVIILPQRQTALVAKQAATLDILSGGRLRLGVGLGWNEVEYISLGEDFHNRGRRIEEQVELLRQLWSEPLVTLNGKWHTIPDAGLNPLPIQRPIPIWFGGQAESALRRIARLADGWLINHRSPGEARPALEKLRGFLEESGRAWEDFGLESRLNYAPDEPQVWSQTIEEWQDLGVTTISVNTMRSGFTTPQDHLTAIRTFAKEMDLEK